MSEPTSAQNGRVRPTRATTRSMTRMTQQRAERAQVQRMNRSSILNTRRVARTSLINQTSTTNTNPQNLVRDHFSRMRSRSTRCQPATLLKGINDFNLPHNHWPEASSVFKNTLLTDSDNFKCTFCGAFLWKEERKLRYNCCKGGDAAVLPLKPISPELWTLFSCNEFRQSQRKYNGLFAFTALGAGGLEKRTWTQPSPPSMLTLHGRAYHRIFDLQQDHSQVCHNARLYIYDSEFISMAETLKVNINTASTLRDHVTTKIKWAKEYKSAVDNVINSSQLQHVPSSSPAYIEFEQTSRVNDGPIIGQEIAAPEIAALLYTSGQQCTSPRAVITYPKDSPDEKPRFLPIWSPAYEPLQYPLLFLNGEAGWSEGYYNESPPYKSKTMNRTNSAPIPFLFYCRQRLLAERIFQTNSRIAQEWACDMYSRHEEHTLNYIQFSGLQQRLASRRSITQASPNDQPGILLPASFHGSPMKRKKDTEDALAVVNRRGKPHLMITVTCNPEWPSIVDNLQPGQQACDRPDLCCRVFKIKLHEIMADLKSGNVFGPYDYHMYVVEFQKRGLPHAHIVVKFKNDGPDTMNNIDSWVWAQLPDPSIANGVLREKVLKFMIHKPCGGHNTNSPCMQTNRESNTKHCSKFYPQPFRTSATVNERTGRAEYRRTDNGDNPTVRQNVEGVWKDVPIGNQWVVPYNPYLLLKYNCHICVDVVTASSCVKYLFKYVTKGADMAKARIAGIRSEIEQYRTTRYISAAEANWRLLGYTMINRTPAVTLIHAHLDGENNVIYPTDTTPQERLRIANAAASMLMTYFERPTDIIFTPLTILDYYESYTVTKKKKDSPAPTSAPSGKWLDKYANVVSRRTSNNAHVCRISFQHPAIGDLFYLRLLLHNSPARSFAELRTLHIPQHGSTVHSTFHGAAMARGLITGDEEYTICMQEASTFQVGKQLRGLFVTLILDGGPAPTLWHAFEDDLIEDLLLRFTRPDAVQHALREIDLKLQLHGKSNEQLNLPAVKHSQTEYQRMKTAFNQENQMSFANEHKPLLTPEQRKIYDTIISAVCDKKGQPFMIDAPAGTGKTFTEKVIAAHLRGLGMTVLIVASTGIAALQLPGGWTAHSMFKLPRDDNVVPGALCNIKSQTQRAELLRKCDLIIWDELPMTHKYCVEALDITLRDLLHNSTPFGGKTILFSGDWRQIGPIVKFGSPSDTVEAAVISSHLWNSVTRMRLTISQRDKEDAPYSSFVRTIGENRQPLAKLPDGADVIPLTNVHNTSESDHFQLKYTTNFEDLINFVYPDINEDARLLNTRAILSTTNASIDTSNDDIAGRRPGASATFFSSDTLNTNNSNENTAFASPEHLHNLNVQGVPPHKLFLKSNALAMITRNLNFSQGLVNGQKGVLRGISPNSRVIQVELLNAEKTIVLVPRICFTGQVGRQGISFQRVQFPLRLAYSLTINKSQGQTLSRIGLDLRSDVFAHGQLYVALSRAQNRGSIMCLLPPSRIIDNVPHTANVVYSPFVEAATGKPVQNSPLKSAPQLPSAHLSNQHFSSPRWTISRELGDGSCGFRSLARHILGNPDLHAQIRNEVVQYLHQHRDDQDFNITSGIGIEQIYALGQPPRIYTSYADYLQAMSSSTTFMGQPEIIAAGLLYAKTIEVVFAGSALPTIENANPNNIYLLYDANAQHYDSLTFSPAASTVDSDLPPSGPSPSQPPSPSQA